jgi:hypothetical protein
MIGPLIALVFSACCCEAGIDVGPSPGEEMAPKAGLVGKEDLMLDFPIALLDAKLFELPTFSGAAEPRFWTGGGRAELSLTS